VAGWSPDQDTNLRNILHFGDEVLKMAGFTLRTVKQLPEIYANTMPGVQIELTLRANAGAKVYTLTRPSNPKKELGIVLHKRKNKVWG
jgi:PDZ domain-containing secreted protein